jgi:hypothetical protein
VEKERSFAPFDKLRMKYALGGGKYDVELKEKFMSVS